MNVKTTEYFDLVSNEDLNVQEAYYSMIMYCKTCKYFFHQKACGCRTIFPLENIYHPTDGNCVIAEQINMEKKYDVYECNDSPVRIVSVQQLIKCINHANQ